METTKRLAIIMIAFAFLAGCKKSNEQPVEPVTKEDELLVNVRAYASQRSGLTQVNDAKLVPVKVEYGDYTYTEGGVRKTITGEGRFTLEKSRALAQLIPVLVKLDEKTAPATVQFWYEYEKIRGGFYSIGVLMTCVPPPAGNPNYALVDVSEVVVEPEGGISYLTKFRFTVPKK